MKKESLDGITKKVLSFNKKRGWKPVAGDLAKSVVIEAAELLEKFQWDETNKSKKDKLLKNLEEVGEEAADVFIYLVEFCNEIGINLNQAIEDKLRKNNIKYPATEFKGKHNNKFYMEQKKKYRLARKK
jgi:NTP pyrophosphatase (non-canonical NTP hydrolase)